MSASLSSWLAFNRTVGIVLLSVLLFGLGEQLWQPFLPAYLHSQAKDVARSSRIDPIALAWVGLYAFVLNLFEGCCYLFGARITARLGDRGSLLVFGSWTVLGYLVFLAVPHPLATVLAALLILGWEPLSVPVTFTTVGATVSQERRGLAFAWQSIQKRLPKILAPLIAGYVLQAMQERRGEIEGQRLGMNLLVLAALCLALVTLAVQYRWMPKRAPEEDADTPLRAVYARLPPILRRLLAAEILTRWCDWLVREFVVLYVILERGLSFSRMGELMALQHFVALMTYLPIGRLTQQTGLKPFIALTFVFFALFPLVLVSVPNDWLWLAFAVYGLREVGEPARKALITTGIPREIRARGVGLYWSLRTFAISWASLAGAGLWIVGGPDLLFGSAFAFGIVGLLVYLWAWRVSE